MENESMALNAKTLHEKAVSAAVKNLEIKGYTILDRNYETKAGTIDIVALDHDDRYAAPILVFAVAKVTREGSFDDVEEILCDRVKCERMAGLWLTDHADFADSCVRFDEISMVVINDGKALLRHHINALGNAESESKAKIAELEKRIDELNEKLARALDALGDEARAIPEA